VGQALGQRKGVALDQGRRVRRRKMKEGKRKEERKKVKEKR
jgi:hypothetical protein